MSTVIKGNYKGEKAVILENEFNKTIILPNWGSKIVAFI